MRYKQSKDQSKYSLGKSVLAATPSSNAFSITKWVVGGERKMSSQGGRGKEEDLRAVVLLAT